MNNALVGFNALSTLEMCCVHDKALYKSTFTITRIDDFRNAEIYIRYTAAVKCFRVGLFVCRNFS